jgi:hypothetical protein
LPEPDSQAGDFPPNPERAVNWDFGGKTIRGMRFLSAEKWGERYSECTKKFDDIFRKKAD